MRRVSHSVFFCTCVYSVLYSRFKSFVILLEKHVQHNTNCDAIADFHAYNWHSQLGRIVIVILFYI